MSSTPLIPITVIPTKILSEAKNVLVIQMFFIYLRKHFFRGEIHGYS